MSRRLGGLGITLIMLGCAAVLVGWNASRFVGAEAKIFEKELTFFPTPVVARMMSLGHRNSMAKLRWIDSFAYFQYQIDHKDDRLSVAGERLTGPGGFQRLYDMLLGLDPQFEPYYDSSSLCTGGILGQHHIALGFLMQGILHLPHDARIWRNAAAILYLNYELESRHPEQMNNFLSDWAKAMEGDEVQVRQVWDWKASMAKRRYVGLEHLPYWLDRLKDAKPDSVTCNFIESVIREQLARYGVVELQALADLFAAAHARKPSSVHDLFEGALLAQRYGQKMPALIMRFKTSDPYGHPYTIADGQVNSPGIERTRFAARLDSAQYYATSKQRAAGKIFSSIVEVQAAGIELPDPPVGASIEIEEGRLRARFDHTPEPWIVRELASLSSAVGRGRPPG
jgi:hypothetical protein